MDNDKNIQKEDMSEKSLAVELLTEVKAQSKRWAIAFFTVLFLWFATICGFVWLWNQYDFASYEVTSNDGGNANYIGNDGNITNGESASADAAKEK